MARSTAWPAKSKRSLVNASNGRKLAEVVAEEIERQIARHNWPVGQIVGSETDLLESFGVSRAVFREAIRIVENHGAARMKRGPNGGLVVTEPDVRSVAHMAALVLDYQEVTAEDLADVRAVVEIAAVERATRSLDEEGIDLLKQALESEVEVSAADTIRRSHDIHAVIASLSGNPALRLFVDVLVDLTASEPTRIRFEQKVRTEGDRDRVAKTVHRAHTGIVEAMVSGDAALATHRMRRHLQAMQPWLR